MLLTLIIIYLVIGFLLMLPFFLIALSANQMYGDGGWNTIKIILGIFYVWLLWPIVWFQRKK